MFFLQKSNWRLLISFKSVIVVMLDVLFDVVYSDSFVANFSKEYNLCKGRAQVDGPPLSKLCNIFFSSKIALKLIQFLIFLIISPMITTSNCRSFIHSNSNAYQRKWRMKATNKGSSAHTLYVQAPVSKLVRTRMWS